jgi:hypothetical protein
MARLWLKLSTIADMKACFKGTMRLLFWARPIPGLTQGQLNQILFVISICVDASDHFLCTLLHVIDE